MVIETSVVLFPIRLRPASPDQLFLRAMLANYKALTRGPLSPAVNDNIAARQYARSLSPRIRAGVLRFKTAAISSAMMRSPIPSSRAARITTCVPPPLCLCTS